MSAPSPRTFVYAVLLPHPTEHRVLVQRDGDGWVLPHWKTTERHFWAAADYVNRTVRERLGVEVTTLRCLPHDPEPPRGCPGRGAGCLRRRSDGSARRSAGWACSRPGPSSRSACGRFPASCVRRRLPEISSPGFLTAEP